MARIIVFHYSPAARVPALTPAEVATIRDRYDAVIRDYPGVVFRGVFTDAQGQGICEWEAPDVDTVREIIIKVDGRPPLDGMVEVKQIL